MSPDYTSPDGRVQLYRGDCLTVLPTLAGIDAVVTDPPYSSGGMMRGDRMYSTRSKYQTTDVSTEWNDFSGDNRDQRGFGYWCALWLAAVRAVSTDGAMLCQFTDWRQLPTTTDAIQAGGWIWRGIAPWDKVIARPMPNRFRAQCEYIVWGTNGARDFNTNGARYADGVISIPTPPTTTRKHATQKPVDLMIAVIDCACPVDGVALDPFMGSGTTGIACIRTGRRFVGIEIDQHYFAVAVARIERELAQPRLPSMEPEAVQEQPSLPEMLP